MMASGSTAIWWLGVMSARRGSHQAVACVRTSPFQGMGSVMTTSNALSRSVATISSRSPPTS